SLIYLSLFFVFEKAAQLMLESGSLASTCFTDSLMSSSNEDLICGMGFKTSTFIFSSGWFSFSCLAETQSIRCKTYEDDQQMVVQAHWDNLKQDTQVKDILELVQGRDIRGLVQVRGIQGLVQEQDTLELVQEQDIRELAREQGIRELVQEQDTRGLAQEQDNQQLGNLGRDILEQGSPEQGIQVRGIRALVQVQDNSTMAKTRSRVQAAESNQKTAEEVLQNKQQVAQSLLGLEYNQQKVQQAVQLLPVLQSIQGTGQQSVQSLPAAESIQEKIQQTVQSFPVLQSIQEKVPNAFALHTVHLPGKLFVPPAFIPLIFQLSSISPSSSSSPPDDHKTTEQPQKEQSTEGNAHRFHQQQRQWKTVKTLRQHQRNGQRENGEKKAKSTRNHVGQTEVLLRKSVLGGHHGAEAKTQKRRTELKRQEAATSKVDCQKGEQNNEVVVADDHFRLKFDGHRGGEQSAKGEGDVEDEGEQFRLYGGDVHLRQVLEHGVGKGEIVLLGGEVGAVHEAAEGHLPETTPFGIMYGRVK
ncbi:hypothetical protein TYRP_020979, partial [Tyrophagus putrescentiae]